jgi:hypothetical protein
MNVGMLVGILIVLVVLIASAYMLIKPKVEVKPKVTLSDQDIDAAIQQEMGETLANVSESEVEQALGFS